LHIDIHAAGDLGLAVLRALLDQAQGRIRGLAVAGEDDDQIPRECPARCIMLQLLAGLFQYRIDHSLAEAEASAAQAFDVRSDLGQKRQLLGLEQNAQGSDLR